MPPLADQEDGEENSDEESSDWVGYDTFLERCNFMREMLPAAKRPKKMHFLGSVLKKKSFFGEEKIWYPGIYWGLVFIHAPAWWLVWKNPDPEHKQRYLSPNVNHNVTLFARMS